jgi:hypothetical protein
MSSLPLQAKEAIQSLIHDLVVGDFEAIVASKRGGDHTPEELRRGVEEYGRTLVDPPDDVWNLVYVYPITGRDGVYAVEVPLWTVEEGESDLTLSLTLGVLPDGVNLAVDGIHVL